MHANCLFLDPVPCSKQAGHPNMEGIFLVSLYRFCLSAEILQQVLKVFERFQPAFLCRFHDAVDDRTGIGSFWVFEKSQFFRPITNGLMLLSARLFDSSICRPNVITNTPSCDSIDLFWLSLSGAFSHFFEVCIGAHGLTLTLQIAHVKKTVAVKSPLFYTRWQQSSRNTPL